MSVRRRVMIASITLILATWAPDALMAEALAIASSPPDEAEAADGLETVPYEVSLQGASDDLEDIVKQASRLFAFRDRPPGSLDALRLRITRDRTLIDDALRSEGYYAGTVSIDLDESVQPVRVAVTIETGPQFLLTHISVRSQHLDPDKPAIDFPLSELDLKTGQPARARDILAAQDQLITALARRAYPLARIVDDEVVVDHATHGVSVALVIDTGPLANFGAVTVGGLTGVAEPFVRNRLPWTEGEPFDLTRLELARERLVKSNLFSSIRLTPGTALDAQGGVPVAVDLQEREHRTIGGTLSWSTDEGPGLEAYWEHRNLFSAGEKLRVRGYYNGLGYGLESNFRKPDMFGVDWDLISSLALTQQTTAAYDSSSGLVSIGADLQLTSHWKLTSSLAFEYLREDSNDGLRHFTLASLPNKAVRDTRDDRLDPTQGGLFTVRFEPAYDVTGEAGPFLSMVVSDRQYYEVAKGIVLAGWADVGAIAGRNAADLPAEKRLYAGGGGSVRGFGYQMAGPVDASGDPIGGRSLLAFGGEVRIKVTDTIGIVPFVEAGTVYEAMVPDFSEPLFWGAGIGLRYHTPIGPIRADIALPLNGRSGIDDGFQVYLSLGQAF